MAGPRRASAKLKRSWNRLERSAESDPGHMRSVDPATASEGAEEPAAHTYEVLLVEDHRALGEVTLEMLQHRGQNVTLARSGEEALRLAAARCPELVLCDLRLPDMDGSELAKRIAKLCGDGIILVAVSAHGAETLEQLEDGLFAFACSKPLDWNDVQARLSDLGH